MASTLTSLLTYKPVSCPLCSLYKLITVNYAAELEEELRDLYQASRDQKESHGEAQEAEQDLTEQLEQASRSSLAKDAELASVKVNWHPALQFSLLHCCICCPSASIHCDYSHFCTLIWVRSQLDLCKWQPNQFQASPCGQTCNGFKCRTESLRLPLIPRHGVTSPKGAMIPAAAAFYAAFMSAHDITCF